jgi:hypothetical protein
MSGLRLCRDCRWQRRRLEWLFAVPTCANHDVSPVRLDLVRGRAKQDQAMCSSARRSGPCGSEGLQWLPRGGA